MNGLKKIKTFEEINKENNDESETKEEKVLTHIKEAKLHIMCNRLLSATLSLDNAARLLNNDGE